MVAGIVLVALGVYGLWLVNAVGVQAAWKALK